MAVGQTISAPSSSYTCQISSCDPTQRLIEIIFKGDLRRIQVSSTPVAFRWPVVGETWVVKNINNTWYLDSPYPQEGGTASVIIEDIPAGDAVINSPTGIVHVLGSGNGSTDFSFDSNNFPASTSTHTLWVSPTGSSTNPGTKSSPFDSINTAITTLASYGSFLTSKWVIQVLPGTYEGAAASTLVDFTNRHLRTYYPLTVMGPNVAPQLGPPAGLARTLTGTGSSFAGGTTFFWGVTAVNANGETPVSNVVSGAPTAGQNAVLTCTALVPGTHQLNTSQAAATATITGYRWYRSTAANTMWSNPTLVGTSTLPTFTDTGGATTTGAPPPADTTGGTSTAIMDGTGAAAGSWGLKLFGDMNFWFYNLTFQNWQGTNSNPSRCIDGETSAGHVRIEDCCFQDSDFGCDLLNTIIDIYGNTQAINNNTNGWGFGLETKKMGWLSLNKSTGGIPLVSGNLVGLYIAESSDSHPTAGYIDNNGIGLHLSRFTRFEADSLSFSRNGLAYLVEGGGYFEDGAAGAPSNYWAGTSYASPQLADLRQGGFQADTQGALGLTERYRCVDANGYSLTGTTGSTKMWDSNNGSLTGVVPTTGQNPMPWRIQPNFLTATGHRLTVKVYVTVTGTAGTKAVDFKIGGQQVDTYTFSSVTTGGGWIEFIVAPTGAVGSNTQMIWHNAYVNGNSNLPSQSSGTVTLGGITNATAQSVQIFGVLGNSADTLTLNLIEVLEI